MGYHYRLATNRQYCRNHHCRLSTNRQCCLAKHCRLEPWTDSVGLLNTAGLSINRQCWLAQHCRLEPWTYSVGLLNTVGLSQEPTLLKQTSLSVGSTNRQCCSTRQCRVEPETDIVACRSVSAFRNRYWCQPPITVGMPLSVQNPTVKGFFEPTVMSRSGVVHLIELWPRSAYVIIRTIQLVFFSRNSVFLSQQFSQNSVFQPSFSKPNGAKEVHFRPT